MRILSIETSCDETSIAVVDYEKDSNTYKVVSHNLNSQIDIHKQYGGVFPTQAKREHGLNILGLLEQTLTHIESDTSHTSSDSVFEKAFQYLQKERELKIMTEEIYASADSFLHKKPSVDYIAITGGPGLEPALWVGMSFAKFLSTLWNIPLININHMEGHISSVLLQKSIIDFPALSLLISGGHTELVEINKWGSYQILGKTRDDAIGEAYDKVARILGYEYPGGPQIAKMAQYIRENTNAENKYNIHLPRPMLHHSDLDFSFSGLKTAVLYLVRDLKEKYQTLDDDMKNYIAYEFEEAVADVIKAKLTKTIKNKKYSTLIVAGGVIANNFLKEIISIWAEKNNILFLKPTADLATDNAIMIALAAHVALIHDYAQVYKPDDEEFEKLNPSGDWSLNNI